MGNSLEKNIKIQLDQGVKVEDLKKIPKDKKPLLQWAIQTNNIEVTETLLEYGAILNCIWKDQHWCLTTPLMCCIRLEHWDLLYLLLKHGADPNFTTDTDTSDVMSDNVKNEAKAMRQQTFETPLNVLIQTTDDPVKVIQFINAGANVNARQPNIGTPLTTAILLNKTNIVAALLNHRADPNLASYNPNLKGFDTPMNTALRCAVVDTSIVNELIGHHVDVNAEGWNEECPIAVAFNHNKHLIPFLLQHGANPQCTVQYMKNNIKYQDTLLKALMHDKKLDIDLIRQVIELGADVNNPGTKGDTPLAVAIAKKNTTLIRLLLHSKADPNQFSYNPESRYSETPLNAAIAMATKWSFDELAIVKILIENGTSVNAAGHRGITPLIKALNIENEVISKELIKKGADMNKPNDSGISPLVCAIKHDLCMVKPLLNSRANPNQKSGPDTPLTALIKTAYNTDVTKEARVYSVYVKDLIQHGADMNIPDESGCTPLMLAIYNKNSILRNVLLEQGADPNLIGYNSRLPGNDTPLNAIIRSSDNDVDDKTRTIIQHGADPNAKDPRGYAPLDLVVIQGLRANFKHGYIRLTLMLMEAGADIHMKYGENMDITLLVFLILIRDQYSPGEAIEYLLEHGADVNEVSSTSSDTNQASYTTALNLAIMRNYTKIVDMLLEHGAGRPTSYHMNTLVYYTKRSIRKALAQSQARAVHAREGRGKLLSFREKLDLLPLPNALKMDM